MSDVLGRVVIRKLDGDHCIATWDRVLIQVWRRNISAEAVANLAEVTRTFLKEQGRSICSIAVVERTSPAPSDEIRSGLSRFYRDFAPQFSEAVVVAEGGGFRSALVRGVGVALSMLAPRKLPFKFVATVGEAADFIGPHLSPLAGGAAGLQRSVDEVRSHIDGKPVSP